MAVIGPMPGILCSRAENRERLLAAAICASRSLIRAQHSGHVGYNVQSVVDAGTHLIVTYEVTNQGHDRDLLTRMGKQAKSVLGREDLHILADKGYFSTHEILACHEAGITATVPRSDTSGSRSKGHFVKADFAYEPGADIYRCPVGQVLTHRTTTEQQGLQMRRYWTNPCKGYSLKDRCTTGHERRVSRWEHEHLVEASNARRHGSAAPMRVRRTPSAPSRRGWAIATS